MDKNGRRRLLTFDKTPKEHTHVLVRQEEREKRGCGDHDMHGLSDKIRRMPRQCRYGYMVAYLDLPFKEHTHVLRTQKRRQKIG